MKGLGLSWGGYFNRESYELIGHELFKELYNKQMKEYKENIEYSDNKYMFLIKVKV